MNLDPLRVLDERAKARAILYDTNEFDLEQALEPLYQYAIESGIVREYGVDTVIATLREAFAGRAEI
ncbi:MAG: hypothetical protein C5B60_04130 [Chloroflexi bacterium]|nr:MAG: hypothetical protein C5B60_04130 [Chloroflexota bacterium]